MPKCNPLILVLEMPRKFPNNEIMSAIGMMYPQYWLNKDNYDASFLIHLVLIKYVFYIGKKNQSYRFHPPLLDYVK